MRYVIKSKNSDKLLTIDTFPSIMEAVKRCNLKFKYWQKLEKKHKCKFIQKNNWKNAIFVPIQMKDFYSDWDIVNLQEQGRINQKSISKALKQYDSQIVSNKIDNMANKNYQKWKKNI